MKKITNEQYEKVKHLLEKPKWKIFEGTVKSVIEDCLKEGYIPANLKTTWKYRKDKIIPNHWYTVATGYKDGEVKDLTKKEMANLEDYYGKGGRVLHLNANDYYGLGGGNFLDYCAGSLGVAPEAQVKKNDKKKR